MVFISVIVPLETRKRTNVLVLDYIGSTSSLFPSESSPINKPQFYVPSSVLLQTSNCFTELIYLFLMVPRIKSDNFPKHFQRVHICNLNAVCFLWGMNWSFEYCSYEFHAWKGWLELSSCKCLRICCGVKVSAEYIWISNSLFTDPEM
jgi:hypothetical protein